MLATVTMYAQQIAVVSTTGATSIYTTLKDAIEGAKAGSVVYLPGGSFPIADSVKITKKLTIIGIGHKAPSENVDGCTIISGNLQFQNGSDGSSVMGCYLTSNIYIGNDGTTSHNVLVRYCNVDYIHVSAACNGTVINQNYIRSVVFCNGATDVTITNNLVNGIYNLNGGTIANNIIWRAYGGHSLGSVNDTLIKDNIFRDWAGHNGGNCQVYGNMKAGDSWGEDCVIVTDWSEVFVNDRGITPYSDYHFKEAYKQYSDKGIYGGTGFSDSALPPVPYIVSKSIPQQTDASGKLRIRVAVKAGE
ncbi:MAG: hypothetical protein IJ901_06385 [Bacteroidaceae bacterium]|nr:hypothetical protein [Bacteroidaceae bacterium]